MADMVYKTKSAELPECINAGYGKRDISRRQEVGGKWPMEKEKFWTGAISVSAIMPTDMRYVADYKDGAWGEGRLTSDSTVVLNECAGILQYCQECFEGLKAYTTEDGSIVTFRPDLNAERMMDSACRLEMPVFPQGAFS